MLRAGRHALASALTWVAPRGLITVLLFLEAKEALSIPDYLEGAVVLIVLVSAAAIALARSRAPVAGVTTPPPEGNPT
jgi:hypothetical protein